MGLVDNIRDDVKKSGQNKNEFLFFREGEKTRIRFLCELDDGIEVIFHDSYDKGINSPCLEIFGQDCPLCGDDDLRTRSLYIWPVYDYESNKVKLLMQAVNNCSPVPALVALYDNYGTMTDRDYVLTSTGKATNRTFAVIPQDKVKFRNSKAKAYSKSKILNLLKKAFLVDEDTNVKKTKSEKYEEDIESEDYEEMSTKELYELCKEREIEVEPKKKSKYYINLLVEYDETQDDWGDDEDDEEDDWDENDVDYSEMSAKELYELCKDRDIEAKPKKKEKYYIDLLEADDEGDEDDWEED